MSLRTVKIGHQIRRIIGEVLDNGEIHDPRFSGMVSITDVEVAPDLRFAKVYYSCFGSDEQIENTGSAFKSAAGYIQSIVGEKLGIRFTPKLAFSRDTSIAYGDKIERLLDGIKDDKPEG